MSVDTLLATSCPSNDDFVRLAGQASSAKDATSYVSTAIHFRYSALPPETGIEMHSGSSYECISRMAAYTSSSFFLAVLANSKNSSALSTLPCQRYTE